MARFNGMNAFMSRRANKRRTQFSGGGGGGGGKSNPKVPQQFYNEWRPPGENSLVNSQKVLFFEGDYTVCPQCNRPGEVKDGSFACPNCGLSVADMGAILHMPIYPNMQLFQRSFGPRKRGHGIASSSHDGIITTGDGSEQPRADAMLAHSEKRRAEILANAEEMYGPDWNNELQGKERSSIWIDALKFKPRDHLAHNLVALSHYHEVDVEAASGAKYKEMAICTKGMKGRAGKRMTCKHCDAGLPRTYGLASYWNPSEPIIPKEGGPGKGHLATLRTYEAEQLSGSCRNCGNDIEVTGFDCPHCGKQVVDAYSDSVTDEDLTLCANGETVCPHCGETAYMEETIVCVVDSGAVDSDGEPVFEVGCAKPERTTIFDAVLDLCIRGSGTDATLTILGHEVLTEELHKQLGKAVSKTEPMNFDFLVDWDPELQSYLMNLENPFAPGGFAVTPGVEVASGDDAGILDEAPEDPF